MASGVVTFFGNRGASVHDEDAQCFAEVIVAVVGLPALGALGPPAEVEGLMASKGLESVMPTVPESAGAAMFECLGPAHLLELSVTGWITDSGRDPGEFTFRVSPASEECLRALWRDDSSFRENFMNFDAVPFTWELSLAQCLTPAEAATYLDNRPPHLVLRPDPGSEQSPCASQRAITPTQQ